MCLPRSRFTAPIINIWRVAIKTANFVTCMMISVTKFALLEYIHKNLAYGKEVQ